MNQDIAAGQTVLGTVALVQLYAGEAPITTNDYETSIAVTKYLVASVDATGKVVAFDAELPKVIASQAAAIGDRIAFFDGGNFNHEALTWPADLTTFEARRAAFGANNTTIKIGRVVN